MIHVTPARWFTSRAFDVTRRGAVGVRRRLNDQLQAACGGHSPGSVHGGEFSVARGDAGFDWERFDAAQYRTQAPRRR